MSVSKVPRRSVAHEVSALLDSTEIAELIRELDALRWTGRKGYGFVEQVLDAQGELESFRTFQKQPAQQRRTTEEHLRRFMGTRSGRKIGYARLLVDALDLTQVPRPLDLVLAHVWTSATWSARWKR